MDACGSASYREVYPVPADIVPGFLQGPARLIGAPRILTAVCITRCMDV
jgi:hypothetical protein